MIKCCEYYLDGNFFYTNDYDVDINFGLNDRYRTNLTTQEKTPYALSRLNFSRRLIIVVCMLILSSCGGNDKSTLEKLYEEDHSKLNKLKVTATAYNSVAAQTNSEPNIGAWGDRLKPGMKSIAVSRDLIPLGLDHNAEVKIEGLPGTYRVLDKMNARWKKKIDIYMGTDVDSAKQWGKQQVTIYWLKEKHVQ